MSIYVVQQGDSLWKIAERFRVPINTIIEVNGLQTDLLMPGLALYIPNQSLTTKFYQIQPGDTLVKIARQYETTVDLIMSANPSIQPYNLQIGQTIYVPTPQKMRMVTLGFIIPYSLTLFFQQFPTYAHELTFLAVATYSHTENGELVTLFSDEGIVALCRMYGVSPLAMIRNVNEDGSFNAEIVLQLLQNVQYRRRFIDELIHMIEAKGYDGVSIDFEFIPPEARNDFVLFLYELKLRLGRRVLHVNVHAKTEESYTNPLTGAQDFYAIGQIADIVAVMTLEFGYLGGPPNPVSPIDWMEQVIRYALTEIDRSKLQVSFPLYGYDWDATTNEAVGLSLLAAQNRAITERVSIQFEERTYTPFYEYTKNTTRHIVWFDDIRSYDVKYKLVDFYGLLGVTFWEVRLDFPQNWVYMNDHIDVFNM